MTQIKRWLIRAVTAMTAMMLVSCVTIPHYIPDQHSLKTMSVREARNIVEKSLQRGKVYQRGFNAPISGTRITPNGITILTEKGQSVVIPLKDVSIDGYDTEMRGFDGLHNEIVIGETPESSIHLDILNQSTNDIVSALFVLTRSGPKLRAMEDIELHFDATAKAYRDASPKPTLPEAARRFKVQAEGAVNDKQFEDAADYYEQAIEVAPWWPEGHFNRALVLGETKEYDLAIIEMKRYLALVPDASDARAAQDKIYDWERKAGKPN